MEKMILSTFAFLIASVIICTAGITIRGQDIARNNYSDCLANREKVMQLMHDNNQGIYDMPYCSQN